MASTRTASALTWGAVAVRLAAALVLVLGPWVDDAGELAGWDVERFLAIARDGGRAWRDTAVEYPPGSVAVFEVLDRLSPAGPVGMVTAHRLLVLVGLTVDLLTAWLLGRRHRPAATAYLLLGLPLVPMGMLRLDLVAVLAAVAAALVALAPPSPSGGNGGEGPTRIVAAAALVTVGVMVKLWPALLIPAWWSVRRDRTATAGVAACALVTGAWLIWAGAGIDPIRQVVNLRGATGWQLESVGGVTTALADAVGFRPLGPGEVVRLELNAFRIGTLTPWIVTVGRALAIATTAALIRRARRVDGQPVLAVVGAVMLGSVAALIVTSPLLSPQFLLWLTPWAALLVACGDPRQRRIPSPVLVTAGATVATGFVLTVFGPADLAHPIAAAILAVRNGLLVALPVSCWRWLGRSAPPSWA